MSQQHQYWLLPVLIALICGTEGWAMPDPNERANQEPIIFIGHLNFDCFPDTVRGLRSGESGEGGYLPKRILWGVPRSVEGDAGCSGRTPVQKKVHQTIFTYPGWKIEDGSAAFQKINGDSLVDIVLHLRAKVKQKGEEADSLRSLVIFSQHGLDSIPVIGIGDIRRFQSQPFFAMDLIVGSELAKPGTRDLSGNTSYELFPVELQLSDRDSVIKPTVLPASVSAGSHASTSVRVFPNPTSNTIAIEAAGVPDGEYLLQLISVNGTLEAEEHIALKPGEPLHRTFDVQHIPNGYYVVRIETKEGDVIGTYPIIITR